jgi:hypothetical protein
MIRIALNKYQMLVPAVAHGAGTLVEASIVTNKKAMYQSNSKTDRELIGEKIVSGMGSERRKWCWNQEKDKRGLREGRREDPRLRICVGWRLGVG